MPEYLDASIANEGQSANGWNPDEEWQPMMAKPVIPTYEGLKSIAKYFPQFSGIPYKHRVFPAWFYHAKEEPKLARTEAQATALGAKWDAEEHRWSCAGEWKSKPFPRKFDAKNPGTGKSLVGAGMNETDRQSTMIAAVVAAVTAQMGGKPAGATSALAQPPADPDMAEFIAFKAWKALQAGETPSSEPNEGADAVTANLPEADEKKLLLEAAAERDIKIDGRWSLDRIKAELDKAT